MKRPWWPSLPLLSSRPGHLPSLSYRNVTMLPSKELLRPEREAPEPLGRDEQSVPRRVAASGPGSRMRSDGAPRRALTTATVTQLAASLRFVVTKPGIYCLIALVLQLPDQRGREPDRRTHRQSDSRTGLSKSKSSRKSPALNFLCPCGLDEAGGLPAWGPHHPPGLPAALPAPLPCSRGGLGLAAVGPPCVCRKLTDE